MLRWKRVGGRGSGSSAVAIASAIDSDTAHDMSARDIAVLAATQPVWRLPPDPAGMAMAVTGNCPVAVV